MSNAQAERAINQLYESDSLRSELRDEEASLLLMWGEIRLKELAGHDLPDSQFDHLSEQFRRLMAAINICVGKRKTSPSQHLPMMASISSAAEAAGYALTPEDQTMFLKEQGALTNQDAISELLGLLKAGQLPQPPAPNVAEAAAEAITPQSAPEVVDNNTPPQSEALPEAQPVSQQNMGEASPEVITPRAPEVVDNHVPPQQEALPEAQQPSQETIGETRPEVVVPQPAPEVVDNSLPPQPEELPEQSPQPPQEG